MIDRNGILKCIHNYREGCTLLDGIRGRLGGTLGSWLAAYARNYSMLPTESSEFDGGGGWAVV